MIGLTDHMAETQQRAAAAPPVIETGVVIADPANGRAQVNVTGTVEDIPIVLGVPVISGDSVMVARDHGRAWVVARLAGRTLAPSGTVGTVVGGSTSIPVTVAGVVMQLPFLSSYTPVQNHEVAIYWAPGGEGGVVLGKLGQALTPPPAPPDPPTPPVPPPTAPESGTANIVASDSGTWRGNLWNAAGGREVAQGDGGLGVSSGAYFYDLAPQESLQGRTVTGFRVRISRRSGGTAGAQTAHLYLHTATGRPTGDVTRTLGPTDASIDIGEAKWVDLPASWGQAIVDGGGGIGVTGNPYVVLNGVDSDPEGGLLSFDWS